MPTLSIKNPISIFLFSATYLMFFSVFMFIINGSALMFTAAEFVNLFVAGIVISMTAAGVAAVAASLAGLGGGGTYAWRGAIYGFVATLVFFFANKIITMIPADMPAPITLILIAPPLVGIVWGILEFVVLRG